MMTEILFVILMILSIEKMQEFDIVFSKDIPDIILVGCLFCIFRGCVRVLYPCKDCEYNCLNNEKEQERFTFSL